MNKSLRKLLIQVVLLAATSTIFMSVMPDYLDNVLGVDAEVRGTLEVPRELPGFLLVFIAGYLVKIRRKTSLALIFSIGIIAFLGFAFLTNTLIKFVLFMVLWSSAMHAFIPLRDATAIHLAGSFKKGKVLGLVGANRSIGLIIGTGIVWLFLSYFKLSFQMVWFAGIVLLIPGVFISFSLPGNLAEQEQNTNKRYVYRKEYNLFYLLSMLFGARKQIFLTFAPWLLVSVYHQRAPQLALAMGASAVIGIFLKPVFGKSIDRFGEKKVLLVDACLIFILSSAYALIPNIAAPLIVLPLLYCFYVVDELLFSLSMARTTYLSSILKEKSDMLPTIGLGGTLDHIISMIIPIIGGILWMKIGPWTVFAMAALISILSFVTVSTMKTVR